MSNLKKRKVAFEEEIETKKQKVQETRKGKIQKYSSSSGSESEDAIPKQRMNQKTLQIRKKIVKKKSSDSSTCLKGKNLSEGKESLKINSGKYSGNNNSPDSDEPPLVIDESGSNGLQKQMENEMELRKSSPVKINSHYTTSGSESKIEGTQEIVKKINYNNYMKSKKSMCKNVYVPTSEPQSDSNDVGETIKTQSFNSRKSIKTEEVSQTSKATTSESESGVEASQETTINHRKVITTKATIHKRPDVSSSESQSDSDSNKTSFEISLDKSICAVADSKTERLKEGSNTTTSESESDTDKKEKLANTKNHNEGEQEPASSDTEQSKISNNKIRKTKLLGKKRLDPPKKVSAPVVEVEREMDNIVPANRQDQVSSDDSAEEEDLNETPVSFRQSLYEPTKEERLKLANMTVDVGYTVLRQHQVESTAGTRTMIGREREDFETIAGFPIKHGKFDSSEDKILKKNWKLFCQTHDWDPKNPKPFLFMKHKNNKEFLLSQVNRKRFVQRLARGLPDRSLYSILQRFKNLFEPHRTCRYTEDEDRVVVEFISKYNNIDQKDCKFAKLAAILKRTRASVWRRYQVLKKKQMLSLDDNFCHSSK